MWQRCIKLASMRDNLSDYFLNATGERSVREMAAKTGIEQTTLNRQLKGSTGLRIETVVALCRTYRLDLADTFVDVGFITEEEASRLAARVMLSSIPDAELTREIVRRLEAGEAGAELTEPISTESPIDMTSRRRANVAAPQQTDDDNFGFHNLPHAADSDEHLADRHPHAE